MVSPVRRQQSDRAELYKVAKARFTLLGSEASGELGCNPDDIHYVNLRRGLPWPVDLSFGAETIHPLDLRWTDSRQKLGSRQRPTRTRHEGIHLAFEALRERVPFVARGDLHSHIAPHPNNLYLLRLNDSLPPAITQANQFECLPDNARHHSVSELDAHRLIPMIRSLRLQLPASSDFLASRPPN